MKLACWIIRKKVKIAFSGMIIRIHEKYLDKNVIETDKRLRNYCRQKDIDYIDNNNMKKVWLGVMKLHLNCKSNSFLAKTLLKYLNGAFITFTVIIIIIIIINIIVVIIIIIIIIIIITINIIVITFILHKNIGFPKPYLQY